MADIAEILGDFLRSRLQKALQLPAREDDELRSTCCGTIYRLLQTDPALPEQFDRALARTAASGSSELPWPLLRLLLCLKIEQVVQSKAREASKDVQTSRDLATLRWFLARWWEVPLPPCSIQRTAELLLDSSAYVEAHKLVYALTKIVGGLEPLTIIRSNSVVALADLLGREPDAADLLEALLQVGPARKQRVLPLLFASRAKAAGPPTDKKNGGGSGASGGTANLAEFLLLQPPPQSSAPAAEEDDEEEDDGEASVYVLSLPVGKRPAAAAAAGPVKKLAVGETEAVANTAK